MGEVSVCFKRAAYESSSDMLSVGAAAGVRKLSKNSNLGAIRHNIGFDWKWI